jgi:hypothetical protein
LNKKFRYIIFDNGKVMEITPLLLSREMVEGQARRYFWKYTEDREDRDTIIMSRFKIYSDNSYRIDNFVPESGFFSEKTIESLKQYSWVRLIGKDAEKVWDKILEYWRGWRSK